MSLIGMALLTEVRGLSSQKCVAGRAMRYMTGETVFHNGSMLPEVRPTQIGMALKTLQVYIFSGYQLIRYCSMRVVAIRTLHFTFTDGVMGLSQQLWPYLQMALGAHQGLGGLRKALGVFLMRIMTV